MGIRFRFFILLLCAALLLTAGAADNAAAAGGELLFISIDEWLPPELINCVTVYSGMVYVPYTVFSDYGLGITFVYFSNAATVYLSTTKDRQLFFEVNSGKTYDGSDNAFEAPAILRSGVVYLPVDLVCSFFGSFSYSILSGNQYGSVLRITSPAMVLSDADFLRVAEDAMRSYSQMYWAENRPQETAPPAQPTLVPPPSTPETHEGDRIYLSFVGLPDSVIMTELENASLSPCFFLTGEEIEENPDLVRRLAGTGSLLGIYCSGSAAESWSYGTGRLYEAARISTVMLACDAESEEACRELAAGLGLRYCENTLSNVTTDTHAMTMDQLQQQLMDNPEMISLRLDARSEAAEGTLSILRFLREQRYEIVCLNETDG